MNTVATIHAKLVEIMETLTGSGQPLNAVYGYAIPTQRLFPFAVIDMDKGSQTDEASKTKLVTQDFIIRVLFQQTGEEDATNTRIEVLDTVLEKFTEEGIADYLDDTVIGMDLTSWQAFAVDAGEQYVIGFDVVVSCRAMAYVE